MSQEIIEIVSGSKVSVDWNPQSQCGVRAVDVIVFDPGEEEILVGQHSKWEDVDIISATASLSPQAIIGVIDGITYTQDEMYAMLRNGGDVPISHPLSGADSAIASSRIKWAVDEKRVRIITKKQGK